MLKKVGIALAVLLLLTAGVVGYMWNQATALPEWYTEGGGDLSEYAGEVEDGEGPVAAPQWIALDEQGQRLPSPEPAPPADAEMPGEAAPQGDAPSLPAPSSSTPAPRARARTGKTKAKRHELRGFHVRRGKDGKLRKNPAIQASRAVYESGQLEVGVILDLSRLPRDKLKPKDRARYERAIENFPGITKRDVWVGVEDSPISVGGYLQLSPEAEVRVGKLSYSLASAAKRMGMSEVEMRMELNRELRRLGFVDPEA